MSAEAEVGAGDSRLEPPSSSSPLASIAVTRSAIPGTVFDLAQAQSFVSQFE